MSPNKCFSLLPEVVVTKWISNVAIVYISIVNIIQIEKLIISLMEDYLSERKPLVKQGNCKNEVL